ncbi:MAG: hypothetical protein ABI222_01620, partial [Opitutaceae bacterium]
MINSRFPFPLCVTLLLSLVLATAAQAAVDNWTSTSSGVWGTTGNWSAGVPTPTSAVTFNATGGLKTAITLSAA